MSLLNDALRSAEQRQAKPQVAPVYTGNTPGANNNRAGRMMLVLVLFLVLAVIAAAGFFLLESTPNRSQPTAIAAPSPEVEAPAEAADTAVVATVAETPAEQVSKIPEPVASPATDAVPPPERTTPPPSEPAKTVVQTTESVAAAATREASVPEKPVPMNDNGAQGAQRAQAEPVEPEAVPAPGSVKQVREAPEAVDLRTARALERLLAKGQRIEAERLLTSLTARQAAPNSREVVARDLMVQGKADRALDWLPAAIVRDYANLRLLRGRALLELGQLDQAVAALSAQIPVVAEFPEYRITLATLLQQVGETEASAGHWAELIAYDDSRPAWWLGLAIALETGGRARSAIQAYAQAASLPGLSPALADYARERLNVLQAGS